MITCIFKVYIVNLVNIVDDIGLQRKAIPFPVSSSGVVFADCLPVSEWIPDGNAGMQRYREKSGTLYREVHGL